jgi:hypothetical protein
VQAARRAVVDVNADLLHREILREAFELDTNCLVWKYRPFGQVSLPHLLRPKKLRAWIISENIAHIREQRESARQVW